MFQIKIDSVNFWTGDTFSGGSPDTNVGRVYFLKDSITSFDKMIYRIEVGNLTSATMNNISLLVWKPYCASGYYCYRTNSCIADASTCSQQANVHATSCPVDSRYSVSGGVCYFLNGTKAETSIDLMFTDYYLFKEYAIDISVEVTNMGIREFNFDEKLILSPGDLLAIYRLDSTYSFPNYNSGNEQFISGASITNFDNRENYLQNATNDVKIQTSALADSAMNHSIRIYYSEPVVFSGEYKYETHNCSPESVICKTTTIYDLSFNIFDQGTGGQYTKRVLVQVPVNLVDFSFPLQSTYKLFD